MTLMKKLQLAVVAIIALVLLPSAITNIVLAEKLTMAWVLWQVGIVLVPCAATYAGGNLATKKLTIAMSATAETVQEIAAGDLKRRVVEQGFESQRALAVAINSLAGTLDESLDEIDNTAQAVSTAGQQILTAAEEQQHAATQQSASLHQTASTVEELDSSARQASDNAQEVVARTEKASEEILQLSEKAQRVSKASEVIDEVSRQIRILALNASIEAARSDTGGGGFSVIATEIRRLADDTRKSTGEIDTLVQDMQEATSSSAMIMEQTVESVKVIGLAMSQQSVATGQITEAMGEMNAGMRQTVETTRSTVEAGEELNSLAELMQMTIAHLRRSQIGPVAAGEGDLGAKQDADPLSEIGFSGSDPDFTFETSS